MPGVHYQRAAWFFFLACLCALAPLREALAGPVHHLSLTVSETAGIRRFGYPVSAELRLDPPLQPGQHCRLLSGGKPILAQFVPQASSQTPQVSLDFDVSLAPYESRGYVVEYGDIEPDSRPRGGVEVEARDSTFQVRHSNQLEFTIPRNLLGLLHQVRNGKFEYFQPGSHGLILRYKDNIRYRVGGRGPDGVPTAARIVKPGPLVAALEFTSTEALRGNRAVASKVTLAFPRSKSWIRVDWQVDDPHGFVAGLGADFNLTLKGEPALVDFGAGSLVYAHLRPGEAARLHAGSFDRESGSSWQTWTGPVGALTPYVLSSRGPLVAPAEGWAHVMDRERCTALAVAGFADPQQESEITVEANGRLQIWKSFARSSAAPPAGRKELTFWLHFVDMPVHVGAATSPQAMLAPLRVDIRR